jgi:hypothetical protein
MRKNRFKEQTSVGKVMASVFCDVERILFVELLNRGATISFRVIFADITEVKTTNLKVLSK